MRIVVNERKMNAQSAFAHGKKKCFCQSGFCKEREGGEGRKEEGGLALTLTANNPTYKLQVLTSTTHLFTPIELIMSENGDE